MECLRPFPVLRRCRCKRFTAASAADVLQPTTSSVHTAARENRSPVLERDRQCCIRCGQQRSSSLPEPQNTTRRSFFRKIVTCSDALNNKQTTNPKTNKRGSIRKHKFRAATRASG